MNTESVATFPQVAGAKPRLVLMGEFSSGKSTLSNILLGGPTLPTQVTATRLPPVFITLGEPSAHAVTHDGTRIAADLSDLSALTPEAIRSLHLTMLSDTLELCDLVDMPGISDPNMPADTWDAVVGPSDHVIWCTHATQAWRQSEAAMWDRLRAASSGTNLLLITQFDKLRTQRDRDRVLARITAETAGKFTAIYPASLLDALAAGDDVDLWNASGANAFMEHLVEMLLSPQDPSQATATVYTPPVVDKTPPPIVLVTDTAPQRAAAENAVRVAPRRVQARSGDTNLPRPPRPTQAPDWLQAMEQGGM
jgi:Dynamin family